MDALTRIASYFPTNTLTIYFIMSNVIINNVGHCANQQQQLMIALLVIFCAINFLACFTDTYTDSTGRKVWVFVMPFYGPVCFNLPTDADKDRVYEYYYLKIRDYVHALVSMTTFLLIVLFTNPISMCLFPSSGFDGTARFDPAIIRTVPIVVAIIMSMIMVCLGEPRQMLGRQNVKETCEPLERQLDDNPIYSKYPREPSIPEGDEEGDEEMPPRGPPSRDRYGPGPGSGNYAPSPSGRVGGGRDGDGYRTPPSDGYGKRGSHREGHPGPSPRSSQRPMDMQYSENEER